MLRFMFIRILQALPVIFVVITATFFLVRSAPGGPFDQEKVVIPEVKQALEAQYRLDLPLHEQYFAYLGDLAQGDLGPSFKCPGRSVNEILFAGLPVTAELGLYALIIALCIGVTAGVFALSGKLYGFPSGPCLIIGLNPLVRLASRSSAQCRQVSYKIQRDRCT